MARTYPYDTSAAALLAPLIADVGFPEADLAEAFTDFNATEDLAAGLAGAFRAIALDLEGFFTDVLATEPLSPFTDDCPQETPSAMKHAGPVSRAQQI